MLKDAGSACVAQAEIVSLRALNAFETSGHRGGVLRLAAGALMLCLWLGLVVLATSERLHHALHEDAGELHHQCPVVTLAKVQLLEVPAMVVVADTAFLGFLPELPEFIQFASQSDLRLTPGRGPPAVVVPC